MEISAATPRRIGAVAAELGVSASLLRLWEDRFGLVTSRTEGGHRRYSDADVAQLRALRDLVSRSHRLATAADVPGDADLLLTTTRALLRARAAVEVRDVLVAFVHAVGGTVAVATDAPSNALPYDLSFGEGDPLLAVAEAPSVVRLRLERSLRELVEDGRRVVALLDRATPTSG
jgi:hypothetical protein